MPTTVSQYQQTAFTTPVAGGPLAASVVLGNDNNVVTKHNGHDADPGIHLQTATGSLPVTVVNGAKYILGRTLYEGQGGQWVAVNGRAFNDNGQGFSIVENVGNVSGAITLNWSTSTTKTMTLTGNVTSIAHTNRVAGSTYQLIITQGGSGSYTVDLTSFRWGNAGAPTIGTTLNSKSLIISLFDGSLMLSYPGPMGA